jgi:peptidoglycan/LPS O-acetylase OafA/YrhL
MLATAVMVAHLSSLDIGRIAVLLFFYLSGYWVTKIWDEKFEGRDALRFYASRWLRIAPLYYLALLLAAAVVFHRAIPAPSLTLLGVASANGQPLPVAWSLDVELQFYLLLPLLAPLLGLRGASAALVAAALVLAGWESFYLTDPWSHWPGGVMTVFQYLPCFALGALTHRTGWKPTERTAMLSLGAFGAMTFITSLTPFIRTTEVPFDHDIYDFFWMLPLLPYVACSLAVRSSPLDRHLGNVSYPLYLIHAPMIVFIEMHVGRGLAPKAITFAAAMGLAVAIYWLIDRPMDRWRVALTERSRRPALA